MTKFQIEQRLLDLVPYQPSMGEYPVRLDANESPFAPAQAVLETLKTKLESLSLNRYPDPFATKLREAFASYYGTKSEWVVAGNGSDELLNLLAETVFQNGDTLVVRTPDFSMYGFYATLCRGLVKEVPAKAQPAEQTVGELLAACQNTGAKMLMFSNPCNPTGEVLPRGAVETLLQQANCYVVVDEAYMDFASESVMDLVTKYENLIVLRTLSKAGNLAGARLGFLVANPSIVRFVNAARSPYNVNSFSQCVGEAMYQNQAELASIKARIIQEKEALWQGLSGIQTVLGAPFETRASGANFFYIKTKQASAIYDQLKKDGILVRAFPHALRISVGTKEENQAVLTALRRLS